ncbi:MAG: hypothetical protein AB1410_10040 [Acidobacteriota bacterium]
MKAKSYSGILFKITKSKLFLFTVIIIVLFNIGAIYYILKYRRHNENISKPFKLHYGYKMQNYSFKDNKGQVFSSFSLLRKTKLFMFFSPKANLGPLKYADTLYHKYQEENFIVFGIFLKNINLWKISPDLSDISIPIVYDKDKSLHKKFEVDSQQALTLLLDGENIVRFVELYLIEEKLMKLLVEKFLSKSMKETRSFKIGEKIPDLTVWDISRKEKYLLHDIKDKCILFFATDCTPCNKEKYFSIIKRFEDEQGENKRIMSIFSRNFLLKELSELKKRYKLDSSIYLLREDITFDMPILIWIDDRGFIKSINQLRGL